MTEARRSSPRATTKIEILFKEPRAFVKAYMLNVSNGGLFVKTENPLPLDTPVILLVKLPEDNDTMEIEGRVVWINSKGRKDSFPKGMGIQFIKMQPEYNQKIDNFVKKHLKEIQNHSFM
jgi:uncharacterized protein (TIGR02266 family)